MKSENSLAAAQYANATIELASKQKAEKNVLDDLHMINQVVSSSREFEIVLGHPGIKPDEKKKLMVSLFGSKLHDLTQRLLELLCDRRRLELLGAIEQEYRQLWREKQNIVIGTLVYAEKPDVRLLNDIKRKLGEKLGKTVELEEKEDKSLIGGFVLRLGDQVIDGSLKGRLQSIEKSLLSV
jgi:F-type H+-transporting ATPase subunit delta